jgi:16S rRNA (cytosine1402-N4)-methyltransferase
MHVPVLLNETMEMLALKKDGIYVDATVGSGGHGIAIVSQMGPYGKFVGIDKDEDAIKYAKEKLGNDRVYLRKGAFSELKEILLSMNIKEADGVLFDLGVSMFQLKEPARGFSFLSNERLDMRMDISQELTAWDVVNMYSEKDIERILREYGEEPFFRRITRKIVSRRSISTIDTCAELAELVAEAYGRRGKIHPETRTFQALRIEVNKELDELKKGLLSAVEMLKTGGRLCVISYHSLEDRIVKNFIRDNVREGFLRMLTKKPLIAGPDEIRQNPSSRSAKLRGGERI